MAVSKLQDIKNRFEIVGNSPLLNRALEIAVKVAPTDMNVLVIGESGVGKENFSKIIHNLSRRKHNPFIAINCGAIPAGTIDSELFGHEKGSFTSAHEARKGYFETVNGGTIFLDEIGELPFETQSRLLRVLESGEFLKVGSSKVQKTDVRIIAATNKDLLELTQKGRFREDLYYRLCTVTIKIPPLRERPEDIPFLWIKFASDVADKYNVPPLFLTDSGMKKVQAFPWPGNIRQLKNIVEQVSILETGREIDANEIAKYLPATTGNFLTYNGDSQQNPNYNERELLFKFLFDFKHDLSDIRDLLINIAGGSAVTAPLVPNVNLPTRFVENHYSAAPPKEEYIPVQPYRDEEEFSDGEVLENALGENLSLSTKEKEMIELALKKNSGKRRLAAKDLGISERTLYRKIKEYNLEEQNEE
jgi:DNA-binding NtrC family response regulator